MEPIDFKFSNKVLHSPDKKQIEKQYGDFISSEIVPLPVWTDGIECVSCWKMSWGERLSALFFGRAWLSVFSGSSQPPVWVSAERQFLKEENADTDQPD